jgi:hypothetical protein
MRTRALVKVVHGRRLVVGAAPEEEIGAHQPLALYLDRAAAAGAKFIAVSKRSKVRAVTWIARGGG